MSLLSTLNEYQRIGGMHIDALLLPLSDRYVVTYDTPILNACDSSSTHDTPMPFYTRTRYYLFVVEMANDSWRE
jgi:hypothetical protein